MSRTPPSPATSSPSPAASPVPAAAAATALSPAPAVSPTASPTSARPVKAADPSSAAADPSPASDARSREEACVDRWLAERRLDRYGGPEGSMYAGGTPLFDERTGRRTDRLAYVYRQHPEAKAACAPKPGGR